MTTKQSITAIESSVLQKYGPSLFTFAVLVLGSLQALLNTNLSPVTLLQFAALVIGSALTYLLPIVPGAWQGVLKVGAELVLTAIALVLPYVLTGQITKAQIILVITGVVKALATQVGVALRTDAALTSAAAPVNVVNIGDVTSAVSTPSVPSDSESNLFDPTAPAAAPAPAPAPVTVGTVPDSSVATVAPANIVSI